MCAVHPPSLNPDTAVGKKDLPHVWIVLIEYKEIENGDSII
jgi:hypothetical protein